MGKKSPKAPTPPDPRVTAAAQAKANADTARLEATLNRVDSYTPWGNVTYQNLGNDRWSQNVNLSPQELATYNQTKALENQGLGIGQGILDRVGQTWGQGMDLSGLSPMMTADQFGAERQRMTDAVYNQAKGFLDPQFETSQRQLETKLANQGITQGSEAYTRAVADAERNKAGAYQQAMNSAIMQGSNEANALFGQGLQARQQGFNEASYLRNQPMNELSSLMNLSSVGSPQYGHTPGAGVAPTDVLGAYQMNYQGQMNNYNQQLQNQQGMLGGLFNLGGALGSAWIMSDRRVKDDVRQVGKLDSGLPVYIFRYKGDDKMQLGVMAQEVMSVYPDAVTLRNGILHVDYARIGG